MRLACVALVASVVVAAGCGGDSDEAGNALRNGTYAYELNEEYLLENGIPAGQARGESGEHEVTLDGGRFIDRWRTERGIFGSCWGTYSLQGSRVTFRFTGGCDGDWAMSYSTDGDRVTWSEIEALDPDEQKVTEVFNGVPWRRTGDVSDKE